MLGGILKRWNWLEFGLIPLVSAIMRVAWLSLMIQLLFDNPLVAPRNVQYPAWLILALLLCASLLRHLLQERERGAIAATAAGLFAIWAVLMYFFQRQMLPVDPGEFVAKLTDFREGLPAGLLVILVTAAIWRFGLTINWGSFDDLWRSFLTGIVALGLLMLLPYPRVGGITETELWNAMILFLIAGLLVLALLAVAEVFSSERWRGGRMPSLNRYWLMAVGTVVLVILAAGLLLGQLLSPKAVMGMLRLISPVLRVIGLILFYIGAVLFYILFLLVSPLINYLLRRMGREELPPFLLRRIPEEIEKTEPQIRALSPEAQNALRILFLVGLVLVIVVMFVLAWRRRRRAQGQGDIIEEREFIWSKELILAQLRDLLRRKRPRPRAAPYLDLSQLGDTRRAIRLLYQRLLDLARSLGHPRPPGTTPLAYQQLLAGLVPTEMGALGEFTTLYILARYAADEPTARQVENAQSAYRRVEGALRGSKT